MPAALLAARATRAPICCATHPMTGAASGVVPIISTMNSAITRPRSAGSAVSCTAELAAVMNVSWASATGISATANAAYPGIALDSRLKQPKASAATTTNRTVTLRRRAASSAPASDPIAMIEPSRPNSRAPLWYTVVAMRALVMAEFATKVLTNAVTASRNRMRGSRHA